uniref:Uncharacterized protein n=1 Tax=Arundo donax TaxID=35708 RepID=A0A0A9DP33_ARUDO
MLRKLSKSDCGLSIPWISSGKTIVLDLTPLSFNALAYCRPLETGTRRSCAPRRKSVGVLTFEICAIGDFW